MTTIIKARLVRIGNSQGIRLPKVLIDQAGLKDEVELEMQPNQIVIRAARHPRDGWDEQLAQMSELGDDQLIDSDAVGLTSWDEAEWEW